ncbi:pentapeptide repeat-containing protein [Chryseobacterium gleum]|uniref:pentapeptide repeat-containing protein n=1 Tax=Chryseobacterium gleum TaxID=250 RepID=UPI0028AA1164|nr:pentapeptide repeat-containing protein [Chryseobacterium gleum]
MSKDIIKNQQELINILTDIIKVSYVNSEHVFEIENKIIDFKLRLPLEEWDRKAILSRNRMILKNHPNLTFNFYFKNCEFKKDIIIMDRKSIFNNMDINNEDSTDYTEKGSSTYEFSDCEFDNDEILIGNTKRNIIFSGEGKFAKLLNFNNSKLLGKIRFRKCNFNKVDFHNAKFSDLADFWSCTFKQKTIFYKTDFLGNVVFSSAIFKENVLFTYTLIDKLIIFRGTVFERGLDLSTAIITGTINYFDVSLNDFISEKENGKDEYESFISEEAIIPLKNKRETYRILKNNYEKLSNNSESLEMKELEMKTLLKEVEGRLSRKISAENFSEYILLLLNRLSNNYGNSYLYGIIFTAIVALVFFYLSVINTSMFGFDPKLCVQKKAFYDGSKYFWQFILPTHRFDYLGNGCGLEYYIGFYLFDFLGRIFVGYGIYQTIQAFRKHK